jgi:hypothetical protein
MAEFAAASSAATGLFSLGLEVCRSLIRCCSAWKNYEKGHLATLARLRGLCNVLEVLHQVLGFSDLRGRPSFQVVHDNIIACSAAINELETCMQKLWLDSDATTSTVVEQIKRARYPMRKEELSSVNLILGDLQSNLGVAMRAAQRHVIAHRSFKYRKPLTRSRLRK